MHTQPCHILNCRRCAAAAKARVIVSRLERRRTSILATLALGITTGDLERIAKVFPNLLTEAVREANGEVEYQMVPKDGCYDTDERG